MLTRYALLNFQRYNYQLNKLPRNNKWHIMIQPFEENVCNQFVPSFFSKLAFASALYENVVYVHMCICLFACFQNSQLVIRLTLRSIVSDSRQMLIITLITSRISG